MVREAHAHADHLSATPFIKVHTGVWIAIGAHTAEEDRALALTPADELIW